MALIEIDLRTISKKRLLFVAVTCRSILHSRLLYCEDKDIAINTLQQLDQCGCADGCQGKHHLVEIPRGHVQNLIKRTHRSGCQYLKWMIDKGIAKRPHYLKEKI